MVCTWTGSYTYQKNAENKNDYDIVCDAIMSYVEEYGVKHKMQIITKKDDTSWCCHGRPIDIDCYFLKWGDEVTPIEDIATEIIAYYESCVEDEASNFGENGYYTGEPWSAEDLQAFTRENMIEYWS